MFRIRVHGMDIEKCKTKDSFTVIFNLITFNQLIKYDD